MIFYFILMIITFLPAKDKWKVSADMMEIDKINNIKVQRLNNNVRFVKEDKILLTFSNDCWGVYIVSIERLTSIPKELSNWFLLLRALSGSFIPNKVFLLFNNCLNSAFSQLESASSTFVLFLPLSSSDGD